ncbi:hypothetical protein PP175_04115 [Aneurinibacillus sp. Ricciae_BoGa-3]|uniref:hypothetical protein n=1 Tax=Aneurinibacillus sp. Ricciae_BoGa-3 TaxID=3022697 RepID=UPI00233FF590|nr:hypothetical protein [Aneurinibacillus sp. Ricciae_BoGa-3]WCK55180.1 hypothetical protein PP175_04115 [Aneurinibacillus sp. Ricciae_BoGa-3]
MSVDREQLKRMIDEIPEQDAAEVLDFIGFLNMKRERAAIQQLNVEELSQDEGLIRQVQQSRADREAGRVYGQEAGLEYLRMKMREFERGQSL